MQMQMQMHVLQSPIQMQKPHTDTVAATATVTATNADTDGDTDVSVDVIVDIVVGGGCRLMHRRQM